MIYQTIELVIVTIGKISVAFHSLLYTYVTDFFFSNLLAS